MPDRKKKGHKPPITEKVGPKAGWLRKWFFGPSTPRKTKEKEIHVGKARNQPALKGALSKRKQDMNKQLKELGF